MNQECKPKIFISYSYDSPEHRVRVLEFAERLRSDGIDSITGDDFDPKEDWLSWVDRQLEDSHFVLVVCTKTYLSRFKGGKRSKQDKDVQKECVLIASQLYVPSSRRVNPKFIPVLFADSSIDDIPDQLGSSIFYQINIEKNYQALYSFITKNQPLKDKRQSDTSVLEDQYELNRVRKLLSDKDSVLIIGEEGVGKTTLLYNIQDNIKNWLPERNEIIVIYISIMDQNLDYFCHKILAGIDDSENNVDATPEEVKKKIMEIKNYKYIVFLFDHFKKDVFKDCVQCEVLNKFFSDNLSIRCEERPFSIVVTVRSEEEIKDVPYYQHIRKNSIKIDLTQENAKLRLYNKLFVVPTKDKVKLALQATRYVTQKSRRTSQEIYCPSLLSEAANYIERHIEPDTKQKAITSKNTLREVCKHLLEEVSDNHGKDKIEQKIFLQDNGEIHPDVNKSNKIMQVLASFWRKYISIYRSYEDSFILINDKFWPAAVLISLVSMIIAGLAFEEIMQRILELLS